MNRAAFKLAPNKQLKNVRQLSCPGSSSRGVPGEPGAFSEEAAIKLLGERSPWFLGPTFDHI